MSSLNGRLDDLEGGSRPRIKPAVFAREEDLRVVAERARGLTDTVAVLSSRTTVIEVALEAVIEDINTILTAMGVLEDDESEDKPEPDIEAQAQALEEDGAQFEADELRRSATDQLSAFEQANSEDIENVN